MRRSRVEYAALRVCAVTIILFLFASPADAAEYTVKADGSGSFTTIQACADAARPGDTCVVNGGVYNEHVKTAAGGTDDNMRITFRAQGTASMQGFDIRHPFITIEGFDITGYTLRFQGLITVFSAGNSCRITNNTIRNGGADVYGIYFYTSSGQAASDCIVRGNRLSNLLGTFLTTSGLNHLFEGNVFEFQNSRDYIRLFGANHVFRRNSFWRGTTQTGAGNHPDVVQNFGGEGLESQNHLFEENWIQDLASQFSQMNSGDGVVSKGILYSNVKNVTFRRNVIVSVSNNANSGMPSVQYDNNTFYRMAYETSGIAYGGSLTRGDSSMGRLTDNVFLGGGARALNTGDGAGFYSLSGATMSKEVIGAFATNDPNGLTATSAGIYTDLNINGYIDANGKILGKAAALTSLSQFVLDAQYAAYKPAVYDALIKTVALDRKIRLTFVADYNFVAGAPSAGFPAKKNSACDPTKTFTDFNFCEPHGINGGNPQLRDVANPLGADGIPFTLDDGLKPLPTSPLCGKGEGGTDIGAYSCDPLKVFSDGGPFQPPQTSLPPKAPANLRIVR
jgi:hypothetical protein